MKALALYVFLLSPFVLYGESFFPLKIGNNWSYAVSVDVIYNWKTSFQVIDSTIVNGKKYFIFNNWFPIGGNILRVDSNKLYSYSEGVDTLVIDFTIDSVGSYYDDCTWRLIKKDTVYQYGKDLTLKKYEFQCCCGDGEVEFLDEFGPQNFYTQGDLASAEKHTITGLIIDDTIYGNIVAISEFRRSQKLESLFPSKVARNILGQVIRENNQNRIFHLIVP